MKRRRRYRRTTILTCGFIAVLLGIAGSKFGYVFPSTMGIVGMCCLVTGRARVIGIIVIGLVIGGWRGAVVQAELDNYEQLYDRSVNLYVTAREDAVYNDKRQWTFLAVNIRDARTGKELPGKIGMSGFGLNEIYQDDVLLVSGKLRPGIGAYSGFVSFAELELVERKPKWHTNLKRNFSAGMLSALPDPAASFAMGILTGQRASLPEYVEDDLHRVGLTHIVAVSGANLTIMMEASRKLLARRSKRLSTWLTLGLMAVFVAITGGSASIVRAAYVSVLSVVAAYYGRRFKPFLLISLVAALTAFINPIYVWGDAAWYLSFLAFFGVLVVSPLLQTRLPAFIHKNILLSVLMESVCAEIMSLPYILYTFGEMSYMGLLANMLIVALIPLAMLLSFIAGLFGWLLFSCAGWVSWPATIVLTYMLDTAHVLAAIPGSYREETWIGLSGLIICYGTILLMVGLLGYRDRHKNAIITDRITDDTVINPYENLGRVST